MILRTHKKDEAETFIASLLDSKEPWTLIVKKAQNTYVIEASQPTVTCEWPDDEEQ